MEQWLFMIVFIFVIPINEMIHAIFTFSQTTYSAYCLSIKCKSRLTHFKDNKICITCITYYKQKMFKEILVCEKHWTIYNMF